MVQLGSLVTDKITGFTGIAMSSTTWLFGCVRIHVESQKLHEGKPVAVLAFDEQRLECVKPANKKLEGMQTELSRIPLGSTVRDLITGYRGVVIATTTTWLGSPARVGVEAEELGKDGKPLEGEWFDQNRVEILEGVDYSLMPDRESAASVAATSEKSAAPPGGPRPDPHPTSRGVFSAGGE